MGAASAFSFKDTSMIPTSMTDHKKDVLTSLARKKLPNGFVSELVQQEEFKQWMRLSQTTTSESWFSHSLEDTLSQSNSSMFDKACQQIQKKLFGFAVRTMIGRNKDDVSFEFDLHEFHRSEEFLLICWEFLPGRLAYHHGGCVML